MKLSRFNRNGDRVSRWQRCCLRIAAGGTLAAVSGAAVASPVLAYTPQVTVAVVGPASGPDAARTRAIWSGAEVAVNDLNGRGGIKGITVTLLRRDDNCSADGAATVAATLVQARVDLVIGHPCTAAAESAAKVYAASGTIFIATSSREPALTARRAGPSIYRIAGRDDRQAAAAVDFLAGYGVGDGKAVAIVHDRTRYAGRLANAVATGLKKAGETSPIVATLIAGEKDFPLVTAKVAEAPAIFFAGFPLEAGMLYEQLRHAGTTVPVLFSDSVGSSEFTQTFGADVRDAAVLRPRFALGGDVLGLTDEDGARLRYGDKVNAAAAVEAYASAAAEAEALTANAVAVRLNGYPLQTRRGIIRFDGHGDAVRKSYDILKWTGKDWQPQVSLGRGLE